ncbi:tonsoku-like protein isoform X1 [Mobula birostris]|uniref:tonsoku-like protein isoform X1 n=1 Tax=Mobula birostris TaxID=1983395 RepID=UPI003B28B046
MAEDPGTVGEIQELQRAKATAQRANKAKRLASICHQLGQILMKTGQFQAAIQEYEQELKVLVTRSDVIGRATTHRLIGDCYLELKSCDLSLKHYQQYLQLAQSIASHVDEQRAWMQIGRAHMLRPHSSQSDESLQEALRAFERSQTVLREKLEGSVRHRVSALELKKMRVALYLNLGIVYNLLQRREDSLEVLHYCLSIAESQNFFTDLYRATYILGTIHQDQELYTQALKYYQAARQWAHKAGMQGESDTAVSQGQVQLTLGEFAAASLHLQKALSQNTIPSDQRNTVRKQLNRALKGERLQRELQAVPENHYDSRLHLYEELGDLCCSVRCYQKGVEYYQDQLACAQRLCCPGKQMAVIHWSLARTYDDLKDYGQALMHYQKELELQKGNDQEECRTLLHMVEVQQKMGTDQTEVEGSLQAAVYHAERSGNSRLQHRVQKVLRKMQRRLDPLWELESGDSTTETESEESTDLEDEELPEPPPTRTPTGKRNKVLACGPPMPPRNMKWKRNAKGETPLHIACIRGNTQKARTLIQQGHPLNERDNAGWTPLHEACNHGQLEIVTLLLDNGVAINSEEDRQCGGITALHDALNTGHLDVVELLVNRGAVTQVKDSQGRLPLDYLKVWWNGLKHKPSPELGRRYEALLSKLDTPRTPESDLRIGISDVRSLHPTMSQAAAAPSALPPSQSPPSGPGSSGSRNVAGRGRRSSAVRQHRPASPFCNLDEDEDESPEPGPSRQAQGMQTRGSRADRDPSLAKSRAVPSRGRAKARGGLTVLVESPSPRKLKVARTEPAERQRDPSGTPEGLQLNLDSTPEDEWLEVDHSKEGQGEQGAFCPPEPSSQISRRTGTGLPREKTSSCWPSTDGVLSEIPDNNSRTPVSLHTQAGAGGKGGWCSPTSHPLIRVRVRVKDKVFLVPVPPSPADSSTDKPTVAWLSSEAAARYSQACGERPRLSLSCGGALLSPSDPLTQLLQDNEEVEAEVQSWDIPPISIRYKNACHSLGLAEDPSITKILQLQEEQPTLDLCGLSLGAERLTPVLRALRRHTATRQLRLSGNRITDSTAEELLGSLLTMPNLILLDISSNQITALGLRKLGEGAQRPGEPPFQSLQELDLSLNPLGEGSSQPLALLIAACPVLSTLRLRGCCLTARFLQDTGLNGALRGCNRLESLDLSMNALGSRGLQPLLHSIRPTLLTRLGLGSVTSHTQESLLLDPLITYLSQDGCILAHLNLSSNALNNDSIRNLARCLPSLPSLASLDLSQNPGISLPGLQILLDALDKRTSCLDLLDLSGCAVQQEDGSDVTQRWYLRDLRL